MTKILFATSVTAAIHNLGIDVATDKGLQDAAERLWREWRQLLARSDGSGAFYGDELRTVRMGRRIRVVPVGKRAPHIASAPDEPPARDSGELLNSIRIWEIKKGEHYRVGSTHWKAVWLEYGVGPGFPFEHPAWSRERRASPTEMGGRRAYRTRLAESKDGVSYRKLVMMPRPHARPALAKALPGMNTEFVAALRTAKPIVFERIDLLAIRRGLLGVSAIIGNLGAFGIRIGALTKIRGLALGFERGLGDFGALASGNLGLRIARRAAGQQAGRLIGDVTRGLPSGFARRVGNRSLSRIATTPALRKMFQ
ncbi:MAG: hypothetical protein AMJ65_06880 [Phycisphaerae bacterium SG8_4]|nr:MAG: hypothetical protein AMJ65_06880 [Phycisphaerae bacterium SG8_4]